MRSCARWRKNRVGIDLGLDRPGLSLQHDLRSTPVHFQRIRAGAELDPGPYAVPALLPSQQPRGGILP